ncbi:DUF11 domain-containing protein [Rhodopirellula halodulae]|uniref:DUF11 domain-containing protein n=1 Tax=Rhodopirellula halodulae TaxID=2894198 RepID=UPI001E287BA6|nr:DUF11 domain-containing protein [Rhodopirellula sp. JC737]MCC9656403.1 DUF11 domain-containing protein [Rhodopirellula sp. JC737]
MSRGLCQLITQLASPSRRLSVFLAATMLATSVSVGPATDSLFGIPTVSAQETSNQEIQQVVGKQLSGRRSSRGLLGNLFGSSSSSSSKRDDDGRTATAVPSNREVDWSGIPTHGSRTQSTTTRRSTASSTPLRDPNEARRVASQPRTTTNSSVPQPPKLESTASRPSTPIRVESKTAPAPIVRRGTVRTPVAISPVQTEPVEIVPKVSRRILKVETSPTTEPLSETESSRRRKPTTVAKTEPTKETQPAPVAKPAPKKTPSAEIAKAEPAPAPAPVKKPEPVAVAKSEPQPVAKPAPSVQQTPPAQPAPAQPQPKIAASGQPKTVAPSQPAPTVAAPAPTQRRISQLVPPTSVATKPAPSQPAVAPETAFAPSPAKTASSPTMTLGEARQAPSAPADSFSTANRQLAAPQQAPFQAATAPTETPTKMQTFGGTRADSRSSGSLAVSEPNGIALHPISDRLPVVNGDQAAASTLGEPQSPWHQSGGVSHDQFQPRATYDTRSQVATRPSGPAYPQGTASETTFPNQMRGTTTIQNEANLTGATPAITSASELPGIRVTTAGPKKVMIRQTHPYEIRVENRGSVTAEGLVVRAYIPDWADVVGQQSTRGDVSGSTENNVRQLNWRIEELAAGESERMLVRLKAARSGTHDLNVDWTIAPQKERMQVQVQEPELALTIDGPDEVIYGQSKTYTIRVLNPGDGIAPNVVFTLSPESSTPQSQRIGDIPSGKEAQFEVELTAQDLGDLKIHGLAVGDLELKAEADKNVRVLAADLEAVLSGPEVKYQNTEALYQLELTNHGTTASDDVVATLTLPMGVTYVGGMEGASLIDNQLRWKIASLTPGARRNYQFRCRLDSTGQHEFTFDCKGSAAGQTGVALTTNVEAIADLVLSIDDPSAPAPVGQDVSYEIVIRNRGSKPATDVRAIAQFSHGIEPQQIRGHEGEVITGQVLISPIARIDAGAEVRMQIVAKAAEGGHHRFRTEVRSGDTILVAEEATHYMNARNERISRRSGPGGNEFSLPLR